MIVTGWLDKIAKDPQRKKTNRLTQLQGCKK